MDKILIIDDSAFQARTLSAILEEEYEITCTRKGDEGIELAADWNPALILLDVIMPDLDGFEVLKRLKENIRTKDIPAIMITSLSGIGNEERGLRTGAVDYITKPFYPMIVKARVCTHIKLYHYQKLIKEQAMIDELTGIPNRRSYEERSRMEWNRAIRSQNPLSIVLMDIDKFKLYNDCFGHPAGDKVLTLVAKTIHGSLKRASDFAGRYGGEEFVLIIPENTAETAYTLVKRVRQAIEDLKIPFLPEENMPYVTISAGGVTIIPQKQEQYETYLKIADMMLYDAKKRGRNQVVWSNGTGEQWLEK